VLSDPPRNADAWLTEKRRAESLTVLSADAFEKTPTTVSAESGRWSGRPRYELDCNTVTSLTLPQKLPGLRLFTFGHADKTEPLLVSPLAGIVVSSSGTSHLELTIVSTSSAHASGRDEHCHVKGLLRLR
jgi:hypothetical protein